MYAYINTYWSMELLSIRWQFYAQLWNVVDENERKCLDPPIAVLSFANELRLSIRRTNSMLSISLLLSSNRCIASPSFRSRYKILGKAELVTVC